MTRQNIFFLLPFLVLFSCASPPPEITEFPPQAPDKEMPASGFEPETPASGLKPETQDPEFAPEAPPDYLTIVAAGDNLYHNVMIRDGEKGDYEAAYREIKPLVEPADLAFINQETPLGGEKFGFSGYPKFNTPREVGRAVVEAGFDIINQANNHIMDLGEKGVTATMDFWDSVPGAAFLGIHRSDEDRNVPLLIHKNNITLGFLAYTYGTNSIPIPKDKGYLVSIIDTGTMAKEIDALRSLCDFLVVSVHWGEEYSPQYDKTQKDLAGFLAEHRVDLVIGHHPHVIQSVEYIPRPDGRFMLCFYSLGNLISAQTQSPALLGALGYVKIQKLPAQAGEVNGSFLFVDAGAIPLVTHYGKNYSDFRIYPLYSYTQELLDRHWKNQAKKELTMDYLSALAAKTLGDKEILQNPFE